MGISRFPFIITKVKPGKLRIAIDKAKNNPKILVADYPKDMLETRTDEELVESINNKENDKLEYMGAILYGDTKDLELKYGEDRMGHAWVEKNNKVYDSTTKMIYDKDLYYEIYKPKNVKQYTVEDYYSIPENKKLYDDIKNTVIEDFKPHGKKK